MNIKLNNVDSVKYRNLNINAIKLNGKEVWRLGTTVNGKPPLTLSNSAGVNIRKYILYGNSVQDGEPTPDNPIDIDSVGDLVIDETSEYYGKYDIPITVLPFESHIGETAHIYLDEPLRKVGEYSDYIDFRNKKVVRNIQKLILDGTENWEMESVSGKEYNNFYIATNPVGRARTDILSNKKTGDVNVSTRTENNGFISFSTKLNITHLTDTVDNWKTLLSTWYTNENPLIINYILAAPIEETIDNLPVIGTNEGTNTIMTGTTIQPSNMSVTYIKTKG